MGKSHQEYWGIERCLSILKTSICKLIGKYKIKNGTNDNINKSPLPKDELDDFKTLSSVLNYIDVLKSMGATEDVIQQRYNALGKFHRFLSQYEKESYIYCQPLNHLLNTIDREFWTYYLTVAREYVMFWFDDKDNIQSAVNNCYFHPYMMNQRQTLISLDTLKEIVLSTSFSIEENKAITNYYQALRRYFLNDDLINDKLIIAKMLLFLLRSTEKQSNIPYVLAADKLYPSYKVPAAKKLFSLVCAEFFPYFANLDNADKNIESLKLSSQFDIDHFLIINQIRG